MFHTQVNMQRCDNSSLGCQIFVSPSNSYRVSRTGANGISVIGLKFLSHSPRSFSGNVEITW
jgi:hypothetical protein